MRTEALLARYPRIRLTPLPTPLMFARSLSEYLGGPRVYIKRDDIGSLAFGGNKTRKLEFIMAQARDEGANHIVTLGGVQSNWVRQTIAAAKMLGMDATAVLEGTEPDEKQGNLLLDMLMGAHLIYMDGIPQDVEDEEIAGICPITGKIAEELRSRGERPFLAPLGGATPIGNLGYISMIDELEKQCADMKIEPTHILLGTGTGGTHAGAAMGLRISEMNAKLIGMSVSYHTRPKEQEIAELCNKSMEFYGLDERFTSDDIHVDYSEVGKGYGDMTDASVEAVRTAARLEGLIMCHTYVGKVFAGLVNMVKSGTLTEKDTVIFVHTGGGVADFAHAREYLGNQA